MKRIDSQYLMRGALAAVIVFGAAAPGFAQDLSQKEVADAQLEMSNRDAGTINLYAGAIGVSQEFVLFCRIKMYRETDAFPKDGSIPFGINYTSIKNRRILDVVIEQRSAYELSYMRLCLAQAKATMDSAYLGNKAPQ